MIHCNCKLHGIPEDEEEWNKWRDDDSAESDSYKEKIEKHENENETHPLQLSTIEPPPLPKNRYRVVVVSLKVSWHRWLG